MISALGFVLVNMISYFLALKKGPYWGLFAYMNIYFNVPDPALNWWAEYLPFGRWSLLTSAVLVLSMMIHSKNLSTHNFANAKWSFVFLVITTIVTYTVAVDTHGESGSRFVYLTFTYCLIIYIMIRSIKTGDELKNFFLAIILFAANLSLNAYLYGRRINDRLEGIGSNDANGSNEFGLLLAAVIPLMFCFLKEGKRHEKLICLGAAPFILNAFILCNSRGAAVAFAGGVFVSMFLVADRKLRKLLLLSSFAAMPVFLYLADDAYIERFSTLLGASSEMSESEANTLSSGRTEIWAYGLEMVTDYPLGAGPNGFKNLARFYMPEEVLTFHPGALYGVRSAHNTFIQVLVEEGIAGLMIWLILCASTFFTLRRAFKVAMQLNTEQMFWKICIFSQSIAFVCINLGGLFNSRVYFEYFWWQIAMAAITLGILQQMSHRQNSTEIKQEIPQRN